MIQLKNVSKFYYSKGIISSGISKVSLTLNKGEFVVITGESGSGKSTLLNVLSGLDSYEEGEMYIDGKETSHYLASDFEEYRKKYIGNIFQNFNLVNSYTVYQNVELILRINGYSKNEIADRVPSIIKRVGLEKYSKTKVSKLSGGQKQRVAIARALAKDTDIIVADEPTGNLDSKAAMGIVELLSSIAHDKLVIVVTHNYEQFEAHATRRIKMHDGKVVEDVVLRRTHIQEAALKVPDKADNKSEATGNISFGSKVRLGVRNTFNIIPKFMLLLIVFVFVVVAVSSQYTSLKHSEEEASNMGFNDYFYNSSPERIVLKKKDASTFTDDDFKAMKSIEGIKNVVANDILLDKTIYIEREDFSYEAIPKSIDEFKGKLISGRMPKTDEEVILAGPREDYYFQTEMVGELLDKEYKAYIGEENDSKITVVGVAYKPENSNFYGGDIYISKSLLSDMLESTYNYNSKVTVLINGKEQVASAGDVLYNVAPSSKVAQGKAIVSEETNNFYKNGNAKGNKITVTAKNIYYTETLGLTISDVYTSKTFKAKTGENNFEANNGRIYISEADYTKLFAKPNYQATVYVKDTRDIDNIKSALKNMGYEPLALKDAFMTYGSEMSSIIKVPMAAAVVIALFFIAYFVIRLILRSRMGYFSILRMLGLAKKNIRRILDVEMFTVINIAYLIFLVVVSLVNFHVINVEYIITLIEYMRISDYVILYFVLLIMGYLISGKFARSLFKKTAMGSFREEEQ